VTTQNAPSVIATLQQYGISDSLKGLRGVPLLKNRLSAFQTPILGVRNCSCLLPSIAKKTLDDNIQTMQNLTRVTFVTDVIAEMFCRKNM